MEGGRCWLQTLSTHIPQCGQVRSEVLLLSFYIQTTAHMRQTTHFIHPTHLETTYVQLNQNVITQSKNKGVVACY